MNAGLSPCTDDEPSRWLEMIRGAGKLAVQRWRGPSLDINAVPSSDSMGICIYELDGGEFLADQVERPPICYIGFGLSSGQS